MTTTPFTFTWVDETQTTFDPSTMNGLDEDVFSFSIKHEEGQIPTLDMVIKNPRIGLLAPGRKVWGWLAWTGAPSGTIPLFFGVLVGVPTNLFQEKVTVQLIARSHQFIENKQAVAEAMKITPYYDPFWFDRSKRDDPDSILEGWSALWHIDRTTLAITASDILNGEDGTVTFSPDDAFYDSVSLTLGQPPLANVRVEATCNWTQRSSGFFLVPTVHLQSYTGDTFMSDWPKAGASIGGGYKVESSFVDDKYHIAQTPNQTYSSSWTSADPNPGQCSNASATSNSSGPALLSPDFLTCVLTGEFTSGVCFPDSDPPVNTPATTTITGMVIPLWSLAADMTLRYDASRGYSEVLAFDMTAGTQGILASPTVSQDTELITISSIDLGAPLETVLAWSDFKGLSVPIAALIFPNDPTTPGGLSYQICITPGVAGSVEPVFSDFSGVTTADGSVVWASLGGQGITGASDWSAASFVPLGEIISLQNQSFNNADGNYEPIPNATSYYICIGAGETNSTYRNFTYIPTLATSDEAPPAPVHLSVIDPPTFSQAAGTHINDGTVEWLVLGQTPYSMGIPIGGTPDNVTARTYFPTARGLLSVEFLISKARARLRMRSRAVNLKWAAPFGMGVGLSCRMNAALFDPRLPGGTAAGKIVSYTLSMEAGKAIAEVEIGCAIGYGGSITPILGVPDYAVVGYVDVGYQVYEGATFAHGSSDTTYSLPNGNGFDDGLHFPLSWQQISDGGIISGSLAAQKAAIQGSFNAQRQLAYLQKWAGNTLINTGGGGGTSTVVTGLDSNQAWVLEREQLAFTAQLTPYVMASNAISWTALLKPCAGNGPFEGAYSIVTSPLVIQQGINLEAPSSP